MKRFILGSLLVFTLGLVMASEKEAKVENSATTQKSGVLNGSVTDQTTAEALVGVRVELLGTNQVSYTDFDGNYSFKNLSPGTYKLAASYVSYQTKQVGQVTVRTNKQVVAIRLKPSDNLVP